MIFSISIFFILAMITLLLINHFRHKNPVGKNSEATINDLSHKANYDTLTELFNRNYLENSLQNYISSATYTKQQFAVFFIDLDYFKQINDRFGHDVGDQLLKMIGKRLKNNIRNSDIAARLGGDEFILVLNAISQTDTAIVFAEKILSILTKPFKIKEHKLSITASIGISFYPENGIDYNSLIKSADLALYKAKEMGRNNYQFCTEKMNAEVKEKLKFKYALKKAIDKLEFRLVYLPKIHIKTHKITGFEALLRWRNEKYGDVAPNKIIPLADEMGIVTQLSKWVIQTAIEQAKIWQQHSSLQQTKIAINISDKHYIEENFIENILEILEKKHFSPNYLQLEINESLIMRDPKYSLEIIHALKRNRIQVIIDNFGTGYSSLNYLHQFGVDFIKIDRHFTQSTDTNDQQVLFMSAIADLAKNLNIKILGEGVETKEQMDLLARIGCSEIQGFYISAPISAEQIPKFLENYEKQGEFLSRTIKYPLE